MSLTTLCLIVAVTIALVYIVIYNSLVKLKYRFLNGFSQFDMQLQHCYELIPNLKEADLFEGFDAEIRQTVKLSFA